MAPPRGILPEETATSRAAGWTLKGAAPRRILVNTARPTPTVLGELSTAAL